MRWSVAVAIAIYVAFGASIDVDAAPAARRALVIANAKYVHTPPLKNPSKDAASIVSKLEAAGFKVQIERDLDVGRFRDVLHEFSRGLDRESEVLFYYAGHGLQFRGENFFVAVDATLSSEAVLQSETFRLNTIIRLLEQRAATTLIFWDACRDNPLAAELLRSSAFTASPSTEASQEAARGGAAEVPPRKGDTYIVFSAEADKKALDGAGDLSPFAGALADHIGKPNLEIDKMFQQVTKDVQARTFQFQTPERLSKLTKDFYFHPSKQTEQNDERVSRTIATKPALPLEKKRPITIEPSDALATGPPRPRGQLRGAETVPPTAENPAAKERDDASKDAAPVDPAAQNVVISGDRVSSTVVRALRVSPDGRLLALGDDEGLVRIVRLQDFNVIGTIRAHSQRISDLDFSSDSRTLLSAGRDGAIRLWDVRSGDRMRELKVAGSIPYSARIHPNFSDRYVLMGDKVGRLVAWDLKRDRIITNAKFHQGPVLSVAYQPRGAGTFLSSGGDGLLKIRLPEGRRFSVQMHKGPIFRAGYSGSGKLVYTVGNDRTAKIWDAARLQQQRPKVTLEGHRRYVLAADISVDERLLVTGGGDKALNIWDVPSAQLIGRMQGHTGDIEAVAFSPDGRLIISASEDKSVRIWSVNNQDELATLFFQKNGEGYAGVTFENKTFGDRNSGLISVFVDGRKVSRSDADRIVQHIGRGIVITEQ